VKTALAVTSASADLTFVDDIASSIQPHLLLHSAYTADAYYVPDFAELSPVRFDGWTDREFLEAVLTTAYAGMTSRDSLRARFRYLLGFHV